MRQRKKDHTAQELKTKSAEVMERKVALMQNDSLTGHDAELVRKLYDLALPASCATKPSG